VLDLMRRTTFLQQEDEAPPSPVPEQEFSSFEGAKEPEEEKPAEVTEEKETTDKAPLPPRPTAPPPTTAAPAAAAAAPPASPAPTPAAAPTASPAARETRPPPLQPSNLAFHPQHKGHKKNLLTQPSLFCGGLSHQCAFPARQNSQRHRQGPNPVQLNRIGLKQAKAPTKSKGRERERETCRRRLEKS
jgi:hypothetical protein